MTGCNGPANKARRQKSNLDPVSDAEIVGSMFIKARAAVLPRDLKRGTPRAVRSEVTRNALLDAAAAVVGESGYASAAVSRITARAGVAQGTFYNYFSN